MTQKEAQRLILNDLVTHFNSNNRAVSVNSNGIEDGCYYLDKKGNKCIAGRWMDNPEKATNDCILDRGNWGLLKPEAKLAGEDFMSTVQVIHDRKVYWNENGLSESGKKAIESIKEQFEL